MEVLKEFIENPDVLALFDYGSFVYGTHSEKSDRDFIMVVKDEADDFKNVDSLKEKNIDITIHRLNQFKKLIEEHEISALECLFLDSRHVHKKNVDMEFHLHKPTLRNSISAKSSNSWVKAKKKFIIQEDYNPYIGQKSAWHALRMLDFGAQIGTNDKIIRYDSCNDLLTKLLNCNSWQEIDENFRLIYNKKSSDFKLVAPKEIKPVEFKKKI